MGHLREILRLTNPQEQLKLAEACEKEDWSCRVLKAKVDQALAGHPEPTANKPKAAAAAFQFHWKGRELHIKVRPFRLDHESWTEYCCAFGTAYENYQAAFPAPEAPKEAEVAGQAA
jgi:predicted nuclease of restriction endonuclease-like (RecB) superfamily